MAFNIKDPEADRLLRELAAATGESLTEAARRAFAESLARENVERDARLDRIEAIAHSASAVWTDDEVTEDEILGYDEYGIPA